MPSCNLTGQWQPWRNRVTAYHYPDNYTPDFPSILVPNVDNVRTEFLVSLAAGQGKVRGMGY